MINVIHNILTGEITEIPYTPDQIKEAEARQIEAEEAAKAADERAAKRQAVLDKLGLTADEAAALLG